MSNEVLIKVEGVRKKFCRSLKKSLWYGVQDMAAEVAGSSHHHAHLRKDEFWAVNDVSFELRRGECLGVIGRNGAGKTTLLKMLNGLIKPDAGRIEMRGRVGALIALGAGFNPILTGRENIYVNGSVLGLTQEEIDSKIEEIIDFADVREFIDTPVQSYSSGMQVRLGFAVASALQPDILLLDEVLAVGDASFRHKCYNRLGNLLDKAAVIFVTHSMEQVAQLCHKVLVLKGGLQTHYGEVNAGISTYDDLNAAAVNDSAYSEAAFERTEAPVNAARFEISPLIKYGQALSIAAQIELTAPMQGCYLRLVFYDLRGQMIAEWDGSRNGRFMDLIAGKNDLQFNVGPMHFRADKYFIGIQLHDKNPLLMPIWSFKKHAVVVDARRGGYAPCQLTSIEKQPGD